MVDAALSHQRIFPRRGISSCCRFSSRCRVPRITSHSTTKVPKVLMVLRICPNTLSEPTKAPIIVSTINTISQKKASLYSGRTSRSPYSPTTYIIPPTSAAMPLSSIKNVSSPIPPVTKKANGLFHTIIRARIAFARITARETRVTIFPVRIKRNFREACRAVSRSIVISGSLLCFFFIFLYAPIFIFCQFCLIIFKACFLLIFCLFTLTLHFSCFCNQFSTNFSF